MKSLTVSIIVTAYNSETTILECLVSLFKQSHPIKEIVIIDNHSSDSTIEIIENFKKTNKKIVIRLVRQKKTYRVATSFNLGAKLARGNYIVNMHSDCVLPTQHELEKLMAPFLKDKGIDLSAPFVVIPKYVWMKYNFWQKYIFANYVDVKVPSGNGQFECIRKNTFLKIGGYDDRNFGGQDVIGGEDADFHARLRKVGKIIVSNALAIHVHYIGKDYSFLNVLKTKKVNARSYGRFVRIHGKSLTVTGMFLFLLKYILGIIPFIPILSFSGILLLLMYSFYYSRKLFFTKVTLTDFKIILVPFLNIFFVYYDIFWMTQAFLFIKK